MWHNRMAHLILPMRAEQNPMKQQTTLGGVGFSLVASVGLPI